MPQIKQTIFTTNEFSEEEFLQATMLSELTEMHLRNEIAVAAEERALLIIDPSNPVKTAYDQAHINGRISAIQALLLTSQNSKDILIDKHNTEAFRRQQEEAARKPNPNMYKTPMQRVHEAFANGDTKPIIPDTTLNSTISTQGN